MVAIMVGIMVGIMVAIMVAIIRARLIHERSLAEKTKANERPLHTF
jgi:hypothetical protein